MATPRQEIAKYVSQAQLSNVFTDYMGIVNAKIYGAEGDGVTNDSSNLQLAVNAANDSSAYAVFLPQGSYSCTGLSSDSNILWWGDNASFTGGYAGLIKQLGQWAIQPSGTTQGDILYYSSGNVWARLAKGTTDQILTQSSNSAPAWGAVPNAALSSDVALSTSGTTGGDILYYSSDAKWVKLLKGTTDQVLVQSSNAAPSWGNVPNAALSANVVVSTAGSTGGDILYYSSDAKWVKLAKGTTDQVMTQTSNAAPSWGNVPLAAVPSAVIVSTAGTTHGDILYYSSNAAWVKLAKGTTDQVLAQSSNSAPSWGNVPNAALSADVVISTAATTHGDILYYSSDSKWVKLIKGTTDQILAQSSNSAPAWGSVPNAALSANVVLSTAGTTSGDMLYYSSDAKWVKLAKGTANYVLQFSSTATAPEWVELPRRNLGTNTGFEVWQRGAGPFTAHNAYGPDRWRLQVLGGDSLQVDRESTIKKANSQYSAKLAFTYVGGGGNSALDQTIKISDGFYHLLGKTLSARISVYANAASAVRVKITGDGTGAADVTSSYHAGDSAWADLDAVGYSVPSDATYILIVVQLAATCTAYVDNAMSVPGSKAADYAPLHPAEEMQRCQRYYEVHGGASDVFPQILTSANGAHVVGVSVTFNVKKAVTPALTVNGTWTATNCGQPTADKITTEGYVLRVTASAAGAVVSAPNGTDDTVTIEANP